MEEKKEEEVEEEKKEEEVEEEEKKKRRRLSRSSSEDLSQNLLLAETYSEVTAFNKNDNKCFFRVCVCHVLLPQWDIMGHFLIQSYSSQLMLSGSVKSAH